jgi:pantoate kinase
MKGEKTMAKEENTKMDVALKIVKGVGFAFSALAALCTGIGFAGKFSKVFKELQNIANEMEED